MGKTRERSKRMGTYGLKLAAHTCAPQGTWEAGYRSAGLGEVRVPRAWQEINCGFK